MKYNLKEIEKKVRERTRLERFKAACEQIAHAEMGIQFLETEEGKALEGAEIAKKQVLQYEHLKRVKECERSFLEKLLN